MFDAMIVKPQLARQYEPDIEYWIDVHESHVPILMEHFKKHRMRKNIFFEDISEIIKVFTLQSYVDAPDREGHIFMSLQKEVELFPNENFNNELECDQIAFVDPRLKSLGVRILCPDDSLIIDSGM